MRTKTFTQLLVMASLAIVIGAAPAFGQSGTQTGKLKIRVTPKQAYVFVDGNAIRDGKQTIALSPGKHSIGVYNYGYTPQSQDVDITAGKTQNLDVTLQATGDKVSGPFGDIEIKGHPRAAVLLNGTTPAYFVGQADLFDNNWIWHQWLLVKPGTYQVTVTQTGQTIWSGPVTVEAGKRMVVYLDHNGEIKTKDFKAGMTVGPQPRFEAGIASATVPIAPVTAQLSASQTQVTCGQSAALDWKASDASDTTITPIGTVPATGDRMVTPTQTTTYQLVAKGPGGQVEQSATINVNAQPTATLSLSSTEVRYHKIGDKVVEQGTATLNWATTNASNVKLDPLNASAPSGTQTLSTTPKKTTVGPIDETDTYTLNTSNACGGTVTRTASLHIVGSIDPAPAPPSVTLASLFYPSNYPLRSNSKVGLVPSQQQELADLAKNFQSYLQFDNNAKLVIIGYADDRGAKNYNLDLSKRRADRAKDYLVSQGVSADKIETMAEGKAKQLDEKEVDQLLSQGNGKPPAWMLSKKKATWLAYNRRVDVNLEPTGQESTKAYPFDAPDARILWERVQPRVKSVESPTKSAKASSAPVQTASSRTSRARSN
jgi:hypothetical protein